MPFDPRTNSQIEIRDTYQRHVDARVQGRGEPYEGPPAPAPFYVEDRTGRQFWAEWVCEEGMGGTRVRVLREVQG